MQISLRAARVNAGLTQDDVARALRKSKQTIVNWENGKSRIDLGNFAALCNLYKIPEDNIIMPLKST